MVSSSLPTHVISVTLGSPQASCNLHPPTSLPAVLISPLFLQPAIISHSSAAKATTMACVPSTSFWPRMPQTRTTRTSFANLPREVSASPARHPVPTNVAQSIPASPSSSSPTRYPTRWFALRHSPFAPISPSPPPHRKDTLTTPSLDGAQVRVWHATTRTILPSTIHPPPPPPYQRMATSRQSWPERAPHRMTPSLPQHRARPPPYAPLLAQ